MEDDTYIGLFKKDSVGYYVCGCSHFGIDKEKLNEHKSRIIDGFCLNGMRLDNNLGYKCICNKTFNNSRESENHSIKSNCVSNFLRMRSRKCDICNLICRNSGDLEIHKKSKRHIEMENGELLKLYCNTCKIRCTTQNQMKTHLETKKHTKLVESGKHIGKKLDLECRHCKITCQSQAHALRHYNTKKHKDMVTSGNIADDNIPLSCDICKITCPSQKTMRTHLETRKHNNLLRLKIFEIGMEKTCPDKPETEEELNSRKRYVKQFIVENGINDLLSINNISQSIST